MLIEIDDLIKARIGLGWTQNELSNHSSVPQQTISLIERKTRKPRPSTLQKLYKAFVDAGWDFAANDEVFPIYSEKKAENVFSAKGFSIKNMNELIGLLENIVNILKDIPLQYLSNEELEKVYILAQQQEYIIRTKVPEEILSSLILKNDETLSYPEAKEKKPEDYTFHSQQKKHKANWPTKRTDLKA